MIRLLPFVFCMLYFGSVEAEIQTREVHYSADGVTMHGQVMWDDSIEEKRPGVLVVHEWWGQTDYPRLRARMLAELGYTALAVDMFGEGQEADHPDDAQKFVNEVMSNLPGAKARFEAALSTLKSQTTVDPEKIAAIGYCFGGYVVLHMALQGSEIDAAASFHGSLPSQLIKEQVESAPAGTLAIYTGGEDPMVPADEVDSFEKELDGIGARYHIVSYPGAKHSFTNPNATAKGKEFGLPLEYNELADESSWSHMQLVLRAAFK